MPPVVEMVDVTKRFGDLEALKGVSWTVEPGTVTAFLGPNGAGKTTAISIMLGLRKPTAGRARLLGMDPQDPRARSRAGVMLQESGVSGSLKVRELVDLFRSYYPNPMAAARAVEMAGLEEKAGSLVSKLSGGQKQRLYFALAVCGDPQVLFLDEPTVSLDVESRRQFWTTIRELAASGRTVILTTHYLEEADQLAGRIVVIDHGRVIADAPPAAIKARVSGRRIKFSAPGAEKGWFEGLPLTGLTVEEGRVSMLSSEPEAVLRALFSRDVEMRDLEVVGADLEEAFVALTGGSEPAPAPLEAAPALEAGRV
ncbi:MAG: ABC transporter ATP-binding protein [Candidatus Dormibacterales bacterium]